MTYNMKKRNYILLLCILLCAAPLMAQDASENTKFPGWYVGLQGGVPFGVSQFSSFGFESPAITGLVRTVSVIMLRYSEWKAGTMPA